MTDKPENNNVDYAEVERVISSGYAVILSDEVLSAGRFQDVAAVMGGALVLSRLRQDHGGNWHWTAGFIIQRGTLPKLVEILRTTGYHVVPAPEGRP